MKNYFRYADDFVIIHQETDYLKESLRCIDEFLEKELGLELHPDKVFIRKFRQGFDFLGYVILPHYTVLRTKTKRRMLRKIKQKNFLLREDLISEESFNQSLQSYLGVLTHCRGYNIKKRIGNIAGFEL